MLGGARGNCAPSAKCLDNPKTGADSAEIFGQNSFKKAQSFGLKMVPQTIQMVHTLIVLLLNDRPILFIDQTTFALLGSDDYEV